MVASQTYKVGLIGALADISDMHLDAMENSSEFVLKRLCDINEKKLINKFGTYSDVLLTPDYKQLLKDEEINTNYSYARLIMCMHQWRLML
jgi:predicted dehydrogenase